MKPSRRAVATAIEAARTALARGDRAQLAAGLRELWRATRAPVFAELYELLAPPAVGETLATVSGTTPRERADAFRALAEHGRADPLVLPALLADPWNPELDELERLQLLAPWSPDPRLASALMQRLQLPFVPDWDPAREQIRREYVALLATQQDPRQLPDLEQLAARPGRPGPLRRQLRGALATSRAVSVLRLDPRSREALAPLQRAARERRNQQLEQSKLLAAIYEQPDADAPRHIYADWLDARGDPRGEFIALQLQSQSQSQGDARERELLDTHADHWTGVLHALLVPRSRVFERGFLARGSIEVASDLDGAVLESPQWATLRSLDGHIPGALLLRAPLHGLRELHGFLSLERFLALRAEGRLQAVSRYECSIADPNVRFDIPLGLDALLVRGALDARVCALLDSPAARGLEELGVYYLSPGRAWTGDHRERPSPRARVELLRAHLPRHISRVRMLDHRSPRASMPEGCELVFERGAAQAPLARLRLRVHPYLAGAHDRRSALAGLLTELAALELESFELDERTLDADRELIEALLDASVLRLARPPSN